MATKRDGVFVWITWLARVMAGEQNCEWASWFKAHHENYDKAPSDFDTVKWNIEHTRQLRRLRLERRKLGERVFLQGENAIRLTLPREWSSPANPTSLRCPQERWSPTSLTSSRRPMGHPPRCAFGGRPSTMSRPVGQDVRTASRSCSICTLPHRPFRPTPEHDPQAASSIMVRG